MQHEFFAGRRLARRLWALSAALSVGAASCGLPQHIASGEAEELPEAAASPAPQPSAVLTQDVAVLLQTNGGNVLQAPTLQLIAAGSSQNQAALSAFFIAWTQSDAFAAQTAEYGVGVASVATTLTPSFSWPTPSYDINAYNGAVVQSTIESLLAATLDTGSAAPASPNTLAVVLVPDGVRVALAADGSDPCAAGVYAWHAAYPLPSSGVVVPYVVIPACGALGALSPADTVTLAASGAIVSALVNPREDGYAKLNEAGASWQVAASPSEPAALCQLALADNANVVARVPGVPFALHRTWSNAQSRLGRSPCVPASPSEPFAALTAPVQHALTISLDRGATYVAATGIGMAAGSQALVPLRVVGPDDANQPVSLRASVLGSTMASVALGAATAHAGDPVSLNVALAADAADDHYVVRLTATVSAEPFHQYLLIRRTP